MAAELLRDDAVAQVRDAPYRPIDHSNGIWLPVLVWLTLFAWAVTAAASAFKKVSGADGKVWKGRYLVTGLGLSVLALSIMLAWIALSVWIIGYVFRAALWSTRSPWTLPIWCMSGFIAFAFRTHQRALYGVIEVLIGIAAICWSISGLIPSNFNRIISLSSGIYVVVRGLDNIDVGKAGLEKIFGADLYVKMRVIWEQWVRLTGAEEPAILATIKQERDRLQAPK